MADRAKRKIRRRTFAQIRAEERETYAAFFDAQADKLQSKGRGDEAAMLRACVSTIRAGLVSPDTLHNDRRAA